MCHFVWNHGCAAYDVKKVRRLIKITMSMNNQGSDMSAKNNIGKIDKSWIWKIAFYFYITWFL